MHLPPAERLYTVLWLGTGLAFLVLLYLLKPILLPFVLAGILAYISNPLVDKLQHHGAPRIVGILGVLLVLVLLLTGLAFIVLPLLIEETQLLISRLPEAAALVNEKLAPWLRERFGLRLRLDPASLKKLAAENWDSVQTVLEHVFQSLRVGGTALLGLLLALLLTPVVMFYLLLDWHPMLARLEAILPRPWHDKITWMSKEIDHVLSQFIRGQLSVMTALAVFYSLALWLAGIPSALAIGLLTGMLIFIPYVGFAVGFALALLVAALQFAGWQPILLVLLIYGIGQLIESFLLTPFMVGERIGLHPLAVIFALMAFGQLFGFFGILLALPASAAMLVGLRELKQLYFASRFYRGIS